MNTQKVAITIPRDLVVLIDDISKKQSMSRSKYIARVLNEKLMEEKSVQLTAAYDALFPTGDLLALRLSFMVWRRSRRWCLPMGQCMMTR